MFLAADGAAAGPSAWLRRFSGLIRPAGTVLDVACGGGRNLRWLAEQGFAATGVDRDAAALETSRGSAELVVADIENGAWPLGGRRFDAVVVFNYLWRPLWPTLIAALDEGGVFIHETFAVGQQLLGRPSRAEFLLQNGELLQACAGLRIVAFEDGFEAAPQRYVQRIVAVKNATAGPAWPRYRLGTAPGAGHDDGPDKGCPASGV